MDLPARGPVPWERRGELGVPQALWQQVKLTLLEPGRFWKTVEPTGSARDAFFFAWLVNIVAALGSMPYQALNFWLQRNQFRQFPRELLETPGMAQLMRYLEWLASHALLAAVLFAVVTIALFPITFSVHAGVVHLGAIMFGLRKHDFGTTVRALGYSSAANALLVIPVVGGLGGLYALVLQIWGMRDLHEGTGPRAFFSVLWFSFAMACCISVAAVLAAAALIGRAGA